MPTIISTEEARPRSSSGTASCTTVLRETTLTVSAAPAIARNTSDGHAAGTSPKSVRLSPQTVAPPTITTPRRVRRVKLPASAEATTPPTPMAVRKSPSVLGSPSKRSWFTTGKRLTGMASSVAARSVRITPRTTGSTATNRSPSRIPDIPRRASSPSGSMVGRPAMP